MTPLRPPRAALLLSAALLVLAGCVAGSPDGDGAPDDPAATSSAAATSTGDPEGTDDSSAEASTADDDADAGDGDGGNADGDAVDDAVADVVADPRSQLSGLRVTREGEVLTVTSIWVGDGDSGGRTVLVRSDDDFRTARYETGGPRRLFGQVAAPRPWGVAGFVPCGEIQGGADLCRRAAGDGWRWSPDYGLTWSRLPDPLPGLEADPVTSLSFGVLALVGGGDGATRLPFERLARTTTDDGAWQVLEAPLFDGDRAYVGGSVVLEDGRLLVLLDAFAGDRRGRPTSQHHGLWVSDGEDWTTFEPLEPTLAPDQEAVPADGSRVGGSTVSVLGASAAPDPVLWVQTWDGRVYVSTDDAASFREVRVRP